MTANTMDRLMNVKALPRGERMVQYSLTAYKADLNVECKRQWFKLVYRSDVLGALFSAWVENGSDDSDAYKWRKYAVPFGDIRGKAQHLYDCWGLTMNLLVEESNKRRALEVELEKCRQAAKKEGN